MWTTTFGRGVKRSPARHSHVGRSGIAEASIVWCFAIVGDPGIKTFVSAVAIRCYGPGPASGFAYRFVDFL